MNCDERKIVSPVRKGSSSVRCLIRKPVESWGRKHNIKRIHYNAIDNLEVERNLRGNFHSDAATWSFFTEPRSMKLTSSRKFTHQQKCAVQVGVSLKRFRMLRVDNICAPSGGKLAALQIRSHSNKSGLKLHVIQRLLRSGWEHNGAFERDLIKTRGDKNDGQSVPRKFLLIWTPHNLAQAQRNARYATTPKIFLIYPQTSQPNPRKRRIAWDLECE